MGSVGSSTGQKTGGNLGTWTGIVNSILSTLRSGPTKYLAKTITRPSNTTTYAIGDVINGNGSVTMEELDLGVSRAWILGGQSISSVSQTTLQYDCLFFRQSFIVAADNSPFAPTDDQMKDNYLGRVSFNDFFGLSTNAICDGATASTKPIVVTGTKVYYVRVATTAYAPNSGEKITEQFDLQKT